MSEMTTLDMDASCGVVIRLVFDLLVNDDFRGECFGPTNRLRRDFLRLIFGSFLSCRG